MKKTHLPPMKVQQKSPNNKSIAPLYIRWTTIVSRLARAAQWLDGWKSIVGFALLYFSEEIEALQLPKVVVFILYAWTGIGIAHKIAKTKKRIKNAE